MADKFTTMRVYTGDLASLVSRFGKPNHDAFRKAVRTIKEACNHPEDKRQYLTAELPLQGLGPMTADTERMSLGGFYCQECRMYIFRGLSVEAKKA